MPSQPLPTVPFVPAPSAASHAAECAVPGTPLAGVRAGIDTCVHCGFCLQACPTYINLEDENDSPRGRILLMRSVYEGSLGVRDESVRTHIDRCLGCRACEPVCPSGVPYGHLLEATRATLLAERPLAPVARLILWVFARPRLLSLAMAASRLMRATGLPALGARLMGGRLGFAMGMLASTHPAIARRKYAAKGTGERGTVALLTGCVMEGLFDATNRATERTLQVNDYRMVAARRQRCCGALHAHSGDLETARELARANVAAFERSAADFVVTNAAGCGAMMKEYGHLLREDPAWAERAAAVSAKTRDVSELLAAAGPKPPRAAVPATVTYDAPCHLLHAQRISAQPLQTLRVIPGVELIPLNDADQCCGAAGIYNLIEPETSDAVLSPKIRNIAATRAAFVATGNPGCLMQIGAGLRGARVNAHAVHPVDLLDEAYARASRAG
ncbi:MAG: heterodisulfide reductase-related iron-sulfur binding cluster [Gemmatimonadota bacterium]|nr:heterodisulfide reductase-related iron-sulfur binding cluster [Gemmatimonadota bacterium]